MMRKLLLLVTVMPLLVDAGGIKGKITGDDGAALAFATIYVKQLGTGAASDTEGRFEVSLSPGTYDVIFQYLGYESQSRMVTVGNEFSEINVTLKTQVVVLQNVTVKAGKEDPAYTIMRKAIAKAKYHIQQIDEYTAKVYIKGKGKLTDYPWLAKKALEKEGITKDRLFISESVSEIKYTRPSKFEEKVIAVYTNGTDNNTSPNGYIFGSFYQPDIAETVSPLSPKSFSYYRFEYLGSFKDRNYEVSKIKVMPRSNGDNVFEGTISIVEDEWAIHSVDLQAIKLGISFNVKQIYNPIEDKAWLPVSQQFEINGKVFGFEFEYKYLATVKDYKIKLNPELIVEEINIIDEKLEKEQAKEVEKKFSKKGQQIQERLAAGQEISNKELRQLVKEYEKQEQKQTQDPDVISETIYKVDSSAYKKDSTYWADIRPTPLSKEEVRGYEVNDSIALEERKKQEGDTLRNRNNKNKAGFQPWDLLIGDSYKITNTSSFKIKTPDGGFNTVEGFNLIYRLSYFKRWVEKDSLNNTTRTRRLEISPIARYGFSREKLVGMLRVDYRTPDSRITLEGGRYVNQFNADEPIHPIVNTVTSLFSGHNFMKIYERDFIQLNFRKKFDDKYTLRVSSQWAERRELFNNTDYTFFKKNKEDYTPNEPVNEELLSTSFNENRVFVLAAGIDARPWAKFTKRNGEKIRVNNSSPVLSVDYRKGISGVANSEVEFDHLEAGIRHQIKVGIRGTLDIAVRAGKFFNTSNMYFMDYKHFLGNRTIFVTTDPISSFRLLDYYRFSTNNEYFITNAHYQFRKFLITRIPLVRLAGVTENVFVNFLATPTSERYTELGYGLDGILRIFRLEAAMSFRDGSFSNARYGFMVGIATRITLRFND
jgi:hypothetical protein